MNHMGSEGGLNLGGGENESGGEDKHNQRRNLRRSRPMRNRMNIKEDGTNKDGNQNTIQVTMDPNGDSMIMERGHSQKKRPKKNGS